MANFTACKNFQKSPICIKILLKHDKLQKYIFLGSYFVHPDGACSDKKIV
jgi:hypothetical protein